MDLIFANNAISSLAGSISNTATSCQLQAGTGILFPHPGANQYFVGTFTDAATGLLNEIVWCTKVTSDTLTIQRGREGTTPQLWAANDLFAELWTAGQAGAMLQIGQNQFQTSNYSADIGVVNAYRVVLTPTLTAPVVGMPIRVKIATTNTGPSTFNPGSGVAPIRSVLGLPLTGGELTAGMVVELYWNGASYNLQQATVGVGTPTGMISPFGGNTAPAGWIRCDGTAVSRTTYSALFTIVGIAFGAGDGVNTFNVPDMRGRVAAHLDGGVNRLTSASMTPNGNTIGATGGLQTESASVTIPNLSVTGYTGGSHGVTASGTSGEASSYLYGINTTGSSMAAQIHSHDTTVSGYTTGDISVYGTAAGTAVVTTTVTNVQPTLVLNYMIKA